jgi:uncharacterized membrane protein
VVGDLLRVRFRKADGHVGHARLKALEREVAGLRERLDWIERGRGGSLPPPPRPQPQQPPGGEQRPEPARPAAPAAVRASPSVEDLLGGRVLGWVGGAAVVLGVAFFLVMAANRGWIDETTRVLLAFAGSTALLVAGLYLHERQGRTQAALAAVATAIAALYVTLTAATQLYDLVDPVLALVFAGLVGAVATAIAVQWDEPVVAGIGILGALLAPVLVDAGTDSASLAFMAVALASAVGVLLWRRWSWLGIAALVVTAPQLVSWLNSEYHEQLGLSLAVLAAFWLLYVVAAIGYELREPTAELRLVSASILLANAALLAGGGWAMLDDTGHGTAATAWVICAAAVHIGGGIPAYGGRMSREIAALIMAVGTALAALGLALAIDGPALVAGWSAEALVLAWAARRFGDSRGQIGSAAFFGLALAHTVMFEAPPDALRNGVDDFVVAALAVAIVGGSAVALSRVSTQPDLRTVYLGVAATAAVYLPSLAIVSAFEGDDFEPGQTPQVLLSAFWAVTGLSGIVVGLLRDVRLLRLGGLALLLIAAAKVFLYDLAELESIYRALSFIALGLLLLGGAFAYQRIRQETKE